LFFLHDSCDASFDDATSLSAVGIMLFIGWFLRTFSLGSFSREIISRASWQTENGESKQAAMASLGSFYEQHFSRILVRIGICIRPHERIGVNNKYAQHETSVIWAAFSPNRHSGQQNPLQQIFGQAHTSNNVSTNITDEKKRKEIMLIIISPWFFLIIGLHNGLI
jgi:hypothetical protein